MGSSFSRQRRAQHPPGQHVFPPYPPAAIVPTGQQQGPGFVPYNNGQFYGAILGQFPLQYNLPHYQPAQGPDHYGQPPRHVHTHEINQTTSIKNNVNLKKHSLKLVPLPGQPSVLSITFKFDASSPCRVSTFVMVKEDAKKACKLEPVRPEVRGTVFYEKGLELTFPSNEAEAAIHTVTLTNHELTDLMTSGKDDVYPLVIRLETLTEEGKADGHTLEELPAGNPFPLWVQAQTTYAMLKKEEEGVWGCQVVKQKIWVKGVSYELQEIYGMEQNRSQYEDVEGRECVICMTNERDTTVWPCRHMCMCNECARALKRQTNKCPICRNEIESLLHIRKVHKDPGHLGGGSEGAEGRLTPELAGGAV